MSDPVLLIIEDDSALRQVLCVQFENEGFRVVSARNLKEARWELSRRRPSLILLDLNLPDGDGLDFCREARAKDHLLPILILTARDEDGQVIQGLDAGADDYVRKPYSSEILAGRVRALLRRAGLRENPPPVLVVGDLEIDREARTVKRAGRLITLTPREFALLCTMALRPGRPFTRNHLLEAVCGELSEAFDRNIDTIVKRLRNKIEDKPASPNLLLTVWGVGYRLGEEP